MVQFRVGGEPPCCATCVLWLARKVGRGTMSGREKGELITTLYRWMAREHRSPRRLLLSHAAEEIQRHCVPLGAQLLPAPLMRLLWGLDYRGET